jgi:hypothetical protein
MKYFFLIAIILCLSNCVREDLVGLKDLSGQIGGQVITYNQFGESNLANDGVIINIKNLVTDQEFSAISDGDGKYTLENIPMGEYEVFYTKENFSKNYIGNYEHLGGTQSEYIHDVNLSEMLEGKIEIENISYNDADSTHKVNVLMTFNNIPEDTTKNIGVILVFSYKPDVLMKIHFDPYGYSGSLIYIDKKVPNKKNVTISIPVWYLMNSDNCGCGYKDIDTTVYCQAYLSNKILVAYNERYAWSTISSISDSSSIKSFWLSYKSSY